MVKPDEAELMRLYRHFLKNVGMFCPVCMRGIYAGQFSLAKQFKIPLVLKGTSKRTEETLAPEIFQDGSLSFFKNVIRNFPFSNDIRPFLIDRDFNAKLIRAIYILSKGKYIWGAIDIQVPEYFDWNYKNIYKIITDEMNWKALPDRDEHVDCLADPAVHYLRGQRCKDLTANTIRYSAEIRSGQMDRQTAIELVDEEKEKGINEKYIDYFIERLGISRQDLQSYMQNNLRHMKFQNDDILINSFNMIRKLL